MNGRFKTLDEKVIAFFQAEKKGFDHGTKTSEKFS